MIAATFGAISLALVGYTPWFDVGPVWLTWWLGDAAGILIFAPVLVLWVVDGVDIMTGRRRAEIALLYLVTMLFGLLVFGGITGPSTMHEPIEYVTLPVLIWAAYRFTSREAATSLLLLSTMAILGTLHGFGPFVRTSQNTSLILLQGYNAVVIVTTLTLAAAVADRRRAEEMVRDTEGRLRLVEEQLRLREQRRANEAEAARDRLREFMAMVVHDLRNPLTVTRGYLQLLRQQLRSVGSEQHVTVLDKMEKSLVTTGRLVDDLLDSTRIGTGRFVVRPTPTELVDIVRQVVEAQMALDVKHRYVMDAPVAVHGEWDAERLRQVLTNLVSNAAKFSPSGTVVRVTAEYVDSSARLSIADQGPGLTPSQIDRLFLPFSRLVEGQEAGGTGLGLYITKGIVEAHHGRVWVTSVIGEGSTFFVELPADG
jgi:signal transduction histidine kinase